MPALPVVERITQNLEDALKGISTVADYHNDVEVERWRQEGHRTRNNLLVLTQGDESLPGDDPPHDRIEWMQPYQITCYVVEQEEAVPIQQRINTIRADVQKAVMQDPHRGDLAIDTKLTGSQIIPEDVGGQFAGIDVFVEVHYRVQLDDPNEQA